MSDKPPHPWDDLKPKLHPCLGDPKYQGAWINMLLAEHDNMGFDKPVSVFLHQWDLHNMIVLLWDAAHTAPASSQAVYLKLAQELDLAWKLSLSGGSINSAHRRGKR